MAAFTHSLEQSVILSHTDRQTDRQTVHTLTWGGGGGFSYSKTKYKNTKIELLENLLPTFMYVCTCLRTPGASDAVMGAGKLGDRLTIVCVHAPGVV